MRKVWLLSVFTVVACVVAMISMLAYVLSPDVSPLTVFAVAFGALLLIVVGAVFQFGGAVLLERLFCKPGRKK